MTATQSALSAFRFSLANPADVELDAINDARLQQYRLGWNAYTNNLFCENADWVSYARKNKLYQFTRPLYNPTTRSCDFFAAHCHQGVLSLDGEFLSGGQIEAIPLEKNTRPEIRAALGQLYQWGNWRSQLSLLDLYAAMMGDGIIEGVENVEKGRVWPRVILPEYLTDFRKDDMGNIMGYTLEWRYYDYDLKKYASYKKVVTKELFQEFRNDEPYNFGNGVEWENIFGFAPLAIAPFRNLGLQHGGVAIRNLDRIISLCSTASRLDALITLKTKLPTLVTGEGLNITTPEIDATKDSTEKVNIMFATGSNAAAIPLDGNLDIPGTMQYIEGTLKQIDVDNPEAVFYSKLREMTTVSGVAVELMSGDIKAEVNKASSNIDSAQEKIFKMLLTMGGMRANDGLGGWMNPTDQQKKFLPFNIDSYEKGDMDFNIMGDRNLMQKTAAQYYQEEQLRLQALQTGIAAGEPLEWQEKRAGMTDDEWQEMQDMAKEADRQKMGDGF